MKLICRVVAVAIACMLLATTVPTHAHEMRPISGMSPKLKKELSARVWDEAQYYFAAEEKKKEDKQTYVDLRPEAQYLANRGPNGALVVSVKLGGVQYNAAGSGSSKGTATGKLKYLVFTYRLDRGKWVEMGKPRWESQNLGHHAASELTRHIRRADEERAALKAREERKSAMAEKKKAALAEALRKKYGSGNGPVAVGPVASPTPR